MPAFIYKSRIIIAILLSAVLLLAGCKKNPFTKEGQRNLLAEYFEANVLNKNIQVRFASDNGTDITSQYTGWVFVMYKNTLLDGPVTVTKNGTTYNGTWSCNDDYSKLVMTLPATPSEFVFLSREWKFTKKSDPIMELAPWGTTEAKVLHMERF